MRIFLTAVTLSLAPISAANAAPQDTRVLFLGNSYTARNNLPALVQGLAAASGRTMAVDSHTPGGNTLGAPQSSNAPHATNGISEQKIEAQPWDVVVLQEQSYIPTIPFGKTNWMFTGAQTLDAKIHAATPTARVMLYQTWGRKAGGQFIWAGQPSPSFPDYGSMQDALSSAYGECASLIDAEVAPAGEAWRRSQNLRPSLELYNADRSHPILSGSYLTACVFHARIYGESPVGLGFTGGLSPEVAAFLQRVAADVVPSAPRTVLPHVRLDPASQSMADLADGASIACHEGVFHAAWADDGGGDRSQQDILYARSVDDGRTWSTPVRVDRGDPVHDADSDRPHLIVTGSGTLVVVFRELRDAAAASAVTADLFMSRSTDGGQTWSTAVALNTITAGSSVNTDVHSHAVAAAGDTVTVVWEEDLVGGPGGPDELTTTRSTDAGATWSTPTILTPFVFPAPDADIPDLAAGSPNDLFLAYGTDADDPAGNVQSFRSANGGVTWTAGAIESDVAGAALLPRVAREGDVVAVAWLDQAGSGAQVFSVHAAVSLDGGATFGAEVDLSPSVATTPTARAYGFDLVVSGTTIVVASVDDRAALAAGGSGGPSNARAWIARSEDAGATWALEAPIDSAVPLRAHAAPRLTASDASVTLTLRLPGGAGDALGHVTSANLGAAWGPLALASQGLGDVDTEPLDRRTPSSAASSATATTVALWWAPDMMPPGNELRASSVNGPGWIGQPTCGAGVANSTGLPARIDAIGSDLISAGALTLLGSRLPDASFGFFLGSRAQLFLVGPGGSQGHLCLGGGIGRFVGPGQIQSSGTTGSFSLPVNLHQLPTPTGLVPAGAGETWYFQAWYRDAVGGSATSNFTPAIAVSFR